MSDFVTVKQEVTGASVKFDDSAVADYLDAQIDAGRRPEQFMRTWLHSHPGNWADPSQTDEETFARVFGSCDWAVMFIIGRDGKSHARLRFNVGPGGQVQIPVEVDYRHPFACSDQKAWQKEYEANVQVETYAPHSQLADLASSGLDDDVADWRDFLLPEDLIEELEAMDHDDRDMVFSELANRGVLPGESEVRYGSD